MVPGSSYRLRLSVNSTNPLGVGRADVVLVGNQPPTHGVVVLSPSSGQLGATFALAASGFSDPEGGALRYQFFVLPPNGGAEFAVLAVPGSQPSALVTVLSIQ